MMADERKESRGFRGRLTRALPGGFESGRIHKALGMGECVGFDSPLEGRGNAEVVF
jgi:hypothetical protein